MITFTELASAAGDAPPKPFTGRLRLAVAAYLARFKGSSVRTPNPTCAATWAGAPSMAWTRWPPSGRTWSCTSGGCRRSAGSSPLPPPAGSPSWRGSTGPACWTASSSTRPPSTSAALRSPPNHPPSGSPTCTSRRCSPPPGSHRTRATSRWWPCSACLACGSSKLLAPTSPTWVKNTATGCCACAARAARWSRSRCRPQSGELSTGLPASRTAGRSCSTAAAREWTGMRQPGACIAWPRSTACGRRFTRTCCATLSSPRCKGVRCRRGSPGRPDRRPPRRPAHHDAPERARGSLDRHATYIVAAYLAGAAR